MNPSAYSSIYKATLLTEVRRRLFEESFARIRQCLGMLTAGQVWQQPSEISNSVGTLVVHVCGNSRQWIVSGLGQRPDHRERTTEFSGKRRYSSSELLAMLDEVEQEVEDVLNQLNTEQLLATYQVQAFRETGMSMLIHVIEHTSYHVGQITYLTKWLTDQQTNYYGDIDLESKNEGPV
jgi:uncharacterized damage-inducible protein DinB